MLKIPRQEYTTEFRTLAVQRVKDGQNIRDVAREFGISHQTLLNWVKSQEAGTLKARGPKSSRRSRWNCRVCVQRTSR